MNIRFQNALNRRPQSTPPVWFMRQAGRYHHHYQALRKNHSFIELCRDPQLAAQVALGPIQEFDFDVSILFSDILFPLDALGLQLSYSDQKGPQLALPLTTETLLKLNSPLEASKDLLFQGQALNHTRQLLPADKSLIGFIGGLWTLFVYAREGGHNGNLTPSKSSPQLFRNFMEILFPLMKKNIQNQLENQAEVVMIFDTAAGELSPSLFKQWVEPYLLQLVNQYPGQLGYYTKHVTRDFYSTEFLNAEWSGIGFDHRTRLPLELKTNQKGFRQGNFDQALLFLPFDEFKIQLDLYIEEFQALTLQERAGWVCGLGHGVLPQTPERNVKYFVQRIREVMK